MRIGLIDFDGKMPNLALMKLSAFYKAQGCKVFLNDFNRSQVDKVFCSVLFSWNRRKALRLADLFKDIEFGGTGWDVKKTLTGEIESMSPDYDLYTVDALYHRLKGIKTTEKRLEKARELVDAGIGFTTRGCIRACMFCQIPAKEGHLRKVGELSQLLNPRSDRLILLDNNLTADPNCLEKLREIRDRKVRVSITQGIDVRLVTPEIAKALSEVRLIGTKIHYAWDLMSYEKKVIAGIQVLSESVPLSKQMCYMLVGFDTTWEEDLYRFRVLTKMKIDPYVMVYNRDDGKANARLRHFARWVNGRIYKVCPDFEDYENWKRAKQGLAGCLLDHNDLVAA